MRIIFFKVIAIILLLIINDSGLSQDYEVYYDWELSCTARKDKFDFILPKVMRRHNIDMWIIIDKGHGAEHYTGI